MHNISNNSHLVADRDDAIGSPSVYHNVSQENNMLQTKNQFNSHVRKSAAPRGLHGIILENAKIAVYNTSILLNMFLIFAVNLLPSIYFDSIWPIYLLGIRNALHMLLDYSSS